MADTCRLLTHERQIAEGGRNMETHAVVAKSPIVAWSGIALNHDAFDTEGLSRAAKAAAL